MTMNYEEKDDIRVAIVVPLSNREDLTEEEQISLKHLNHFLGRYDRYIILPHNLRVTLPGFRRKEFSRKFFGSAAAHNRLMLSPKFYQVFSDYEFILIYHLDSLVFSDQLAQWCGMDFDFIGAPWIEYHSAPYAGLKGFEGKVGNGGFSLRKISSFLEVCQSQRPQIEPGLYWRHNYEDEPGHVRLINTPRRILKHLQVFNSVRWEMFRYWRNEEHFWANRAIHYYPEFNIAPAEMALRFAFECAPRLCFEKNNYQLPFGCHAWQKYDRKFWEPYLLN